MSDFIDFTDLNRALSGVVPNTPSQMIERYVRVNNSIIGALSNVARDYGTDYVLVQRLQEDPQTGSVSDQTTHNARTIPNQRVIKTQQNVKALVSEKEGLKTAMGATAITYDLGGNSILKVRVMTPENIVSPTISVQSPSRGHVNIKFMPATADGSPYSDVFPWYVTFGSSSYNGSMPSEGIYEFGMIDVVFELYSVDEHDRDKLTLLRFQHFQFRSFGGPSTSSNLAGQFIIGCEVNTQYNMHQGAAETLYYQYSGDGVPDNYNVGQDINVEFNLENDAMVLQSFLVVPGNLIHQLLEVPGFNNDSIINGLSRTYIGVLLYILVVLLGRSLVYVIAPSFGSVRQWDLRTTSTTGVYFSRFKCQLSKYAFPMVRNDDYPLTDYIQESVTTNVGVVAKLFDPIGLDAAIQALIDIPVIE